MKISFSIYAFVLLSGSLLFPHKVSAQALEKMSCQTVIVDTNRNLVAGMTVKMNLSILQDSFEGAVINTEMRTDSDRPATSENQGERTTVIGGDNTLSIGDLAHGGVVFWVDETGQRGLVAAIEDQDGGSGTEWIGKGFDKMRSTNAREDGIYAGKLNTPVIIAAHSYRNLTGNYAALVCANYNGGGFDDWYLPSKAELDLMYQNKDIIDATAVANGGSAFAGVYYWSSTEGSMHTAWDQCFNTGHQSDYGSKIYTGKVRAVRAF